MHLKRMMHILFRGVRILCWNKYFASGMSSNFSPRRKEVYWRKNGKQFVTPYKSLDRKIFENAYYVFGSKLVKMKWSLIKVSLGICKSLAQPRPADWSKNMKKTHIKPIFCCCNSPKISRSAKCAWKNNSAKKVWTELLDPPKKTFQSDKNEKLSAYPR